MLAGGGAGEAEPPVIIDRPASEETTGAGESGRPWASRSRPRKLSDDSSATRRRQGGHDSRCLLTDSAVASSSLPGGGLEKRPSGRSPNFESELLSLGP